MKTFAIGFPDPKYDETRYAELAARHLGTEHQTFIVEPKAWETLPALAWQFDEPFADSSALPTWYVARETRRLGDGRPDRRRRRRALRRLRPLPGTGADRAVPPAPGRPAPRAGRDDGPRAAPLGAVEDPAPQAPAALRAHQRAGRGALPRLDDDLRRGRPAGALLRRPARPAGLGRVGARTTRSEADPAALLSARPSPPPRAATASPAPWSPTS